MREILKSSRSFDQFAARTQRSFVTTCLQRMQQRQTDRTREPLPPLESLLIVGVVAADEELADKWAVGQRNNVPSRAGHSFKCPLRLQPEVNRKRGSQPFQTSGQQLDDEVRVSRGSRNAMEVRGQ